MSDNSEPGSHGEGKRGIARQLMQASMDARANGNQDEAERLLDEAQRTDPEAVADALTESPQGASVDAADAGDDAEVAAISRTIQPGSDAPSRAGITESGSGADGQ